MKISSGDFLAKYRQLFLARAPGIGVFAYWKMKYLIETGACYHLPEHDCWYMIREGHLLVYYAPDGRMHIPIEELNRLGCISLPAPLYNSIKAGLVGFNAKYDWNLRYDFAYQPEVQDIPRYEAVDFDFANRAHDRKAAEMIGWLRARNIKKVASNMTSLSAFDPKLWFFVKDKAKGNLAAVSISAYCAEARQADLDYIFVAPEYQGKGCGRFLMEETIRRCEGKSEDICVAGTVAFYRRCGFVDYELWVWAAKEGYKFRASGIQP
ncbi:MAG: GNAT family N-acetyltransferase [Oscillospiraceae bacterium]|nr:GNAT family N-acetyltransferase [Oscillospiraceae bacterium]